MIAATPDVEARLAPVIVELLGRLRVELELGHEPAIDAAGVLTPPPHPTQALARVFIDATHDDVAILYLVDSAWERMLVRRLPLESGLDEVAREQLAHVVESAIQSLLAGGKIGVARADAAVALGLGPPKTETPKSDDEPRAVSRPPDPALARPAPLVPQRTQRTPVALRARLGAGWALAPWTPQTLVQGPQLLLSLGAGRGRVSWGGTLLAQYRLEREVRSELVGMAIEGGAVRVLAHARYELEPRVALRAALGAGFDHETFRPRAAASSSVILGGDGVHTSGVVASTLGVEVCIAGPFWLGAEAGADFDLAPDDYVVLQRERFVAIAEPLRLRPTFSTLLSWAL